MVCLKPFFCLDPRRWWVFVVNRGVQNAEIGRSFVPFSSASQIVRATLAGDNPAGILGAYPSIALSSRPVSVCGVHPREAMFGDHAGDVGDCAAILELVTECAADASCSSGEQHRTVPQTGCLLHWNILSSFSSICRRGSVISLRGRQSNRSDGGLMVIGRVKDTVVGATTAPFSHGPRPREHTLDHWGDPGCSDPTRCRGA